MNFSFEFLLLTLSRSFSYPRELFQTFKRYPNSPTIDIFLLRLGLSRFWDVLVLTCVKKGGLFSQKRFQRQKEKCFVFSCSWFLTKLFYWNNRFNWIRFYIESHFYLYFLFGFFAHFLLQVLTFGVDRQNVWSTVLKFWCLGVGNMCLFWRNSFFPAF